MRIPARAFLHFVLWVLACPHPASAAHHIGPSPGPIPASFFGIHLHRATTSTRWPFVNFGTWRSWDSGVSWRSIEPEAGVRDFSMLDQLINLARDHGADPLITLGVTPQWASARPNEPYVYGAGGAAQPRDMRDWEGFVESVAARYKGRVRYYELWNEPAFSDRGSSDGTFFTGTTAQMVQMACSARGTLRHVDPEARLLTPGFVGPVERLTDFLAAGGKDCTDIAAFHFYSRTPEGMLESIRAAQAGLARIGWSNRELWNTEAGYPVLESEAQAHRRPDAAAISQWTAASYIPRALVLAAASGLRRFYYYAWEDLLSTDGDPTVAARSLATTVRWLRGAIVQSCDTTDDAVWTCRLSRQDHRAWIVWTTRHERRLAVPASWSAAAYESADGSAGTIEGMVVPISGLPKLVKTDSSAWLP